MSDVVTMLTDVGEYQNGQTYRVRSRFADHRELEDKVIILDDISVEDADPIEGV